MPMVSASRPSRIYELYCHYVAGLVGEGLTRLCRHLGLTDSTDCHPMVCFLCIFLKLTSWSFKGGKRCISTFFNMVVVTSGWLGDGGDLEYLCTIR